jgi:hypothetical protein
MAQKYSGEVTIVGTLRGPRISVLGDTGHFGTGGGFKCHWQIASVKIDAITTVQIELLAYSYVLITKLPSAGSLVLRRRLTTQVEEASR